jgi:hypothetical protein
MKRVGILAFLLPFFTFAAYANGPVNKVTGSFLRGVDVPNFAIELTAHERVVMKNGKTRPAKGMVTAYHLTKSDRYFAFDVECVNVISETDAVLSGRIVMAGPDWEIWIGEYFLNWVHDGGEPGAYADEYHTSRTPDAIEAMNFCENPPESPVDMGKHWTVFEGNIQIHYRDAN